MKLRVASPAVLALAFALIVPASSAADVTFHVNSTKDTPDKTDVDGKCLATNGKCTLRAAIQEADAHSDVDVIDLPSGDYVLTIAGAILIPAALVALFSAPGLAQGSTLDFVCTGHHGRG